MYILSFFGRQYIRYERINYGICNNRRRIFTILFAKFVYDLQARLDKEPPKTPLQLQAEEYQKILPQVWE